MRDPEAIRRHVSARLVLQAYESPRIMLQIAVGGFASDKLDELLTVSCDGEPIAVTERHVEPACRVHTFQARPGLVVVDYRATALGRAAVTVAAPTDEIVYLRPSRYAESDRLTATAQAEFGHLTGIRDRIAAVVAWVNSRMAYVPGLSRPTDGAMDTMLARYGVCRDFTHLLIALLRALDVPARFAAVYAPGLVPMDFHAVAEVLVDGRWLIVDATGLAPRSSMLRIATGRDAADTAFASVYGGAVDFLETSVGASIDADLPSHESASDVALT